MPRQIRHDRELSRRAGPGLREWLEASARSFERGEGHEENLAYLLGRDFVYADAWRQAISAFEWLVDNTAQHPEPLIVRAIVPLTDVLQLVPEAIDPAMIPSQVSPDRPPSLVVMPPALAVDHRRFEEYRVALSLDVKGAAATYSVGRWFEWPHEGVWMRAVILERF